MKIESQATDVTFFEDRARVRRTARLEVEKGVNSFEITGVSALVDETSLVVTTSSTATGTETTSIKASQVRRWLESPSDDDSEREKLKAQRDELSRKYHAILESQRFLNAELGALKELETTLLKALEAVPSSETSQSKDWLASFEELTVSFDVTIRRLSEVETQRHALEDELRRAEALLQAARQEEPELKAAVEVQVESSATGFSELVLEYFVPCALWRPSHRAMLRRGQSPTLEVTTLATVWQNTGENWSQVSAHFSTARLARPSSPPLLDDDVLIPRQKSSEERKTIQAEFRDQIISEFEDEHRRTIDEMPGIDDGGRPLTFEALKPVTIASTGEPLQVECHQVVGPVEVEQVVYPELMDAPHLVARARWAGEAPLLAGPLALVREQEYAGFSRTDFVAPGDALRIGFGPHHALRVQRRVDESRGQARISGKQWIKREVQLFFSNLSGEEQRFDVVERIPVSEIEEITVTLEAPGRRADKDGFVRFEVVLAPRETRKESLSYRLDMSSQVELSV